MVRTSPSDSAPVLKRPGPFSYDAGSRTVPLRHEFVNKFLSNNIAQNFIDYIVATIIGSNHARTRQSKSMAPGA